MTILIKSWRVVILLAIWLLPAILILLIPAPAIAETICFWDYDETSSTCAHPFNKKPADNSHCIAETPAPYSHYKCCCLGTEDPVYTPANSLIPKLQIPIPDLRLSNIVDNGNEIDVPWIAEYVIALYKYSTLVLVALAGLALIVGGVLWLTSGGESGRVRKSQEVILGSVLGLILLFSAYVILLTINPDLTNMQTITVEKIIANNLESAEPQEENIALDTRTKACKDENNKSKNVGASCKMGDTPGYCKEAYNSESDELLTACQPCLKIGDKCNYNNTDYECPNQAGECGNEVSGNDCDARSTSSWFPNVPWMFSRTVKCNSEHTVIVPSILLFNNLFNNKVYIECRCK